MPSHGRGSVGVVLAIVTSFAILLASCTGASAPAAPSPVVSVPTTAQADSQTAGAQQAPASTTGAPGTAPAPAASPSPSLVASTSTAAVSTSSTVAAGVAPRVEGNLTVFAAASLTDALNDLKGSIEKNNPGTTIAYSFAGSPTLRTQLGQGAKADVFASADEPNMQGAQKDGTIGGDPRVFARNKLTVIVPVANPAGIAKPQDLAKPGIKLVLAQKDVPVGNYARQSLAKLSADPAYGTDFAAHVLANLKSDESNVKDVVAKVQLGEADAGIVYLTDVTASVRAAVKAIDIPDQFNVIASYPAAVVKGSANAAGARAFVDYLVSPDGQRVLAKYGFAPAPVQGAAGTGNVALTGQVDKPSTLAVADIQKLPQETVKVTFASSAGTETHSFTGPRLAAVVQLANLKVDAGRKNDKLRKFVVATGRDGYEVVVAWGELDPDFANAPVLLAWQDNGQPLSAQDGPVRLVVPTDSHGGRYVSGLTRLDVRDAGPPSAP